MPRQPDIGFYIKQDLGQLANGTTGCHRWVPKRYKDWRCLNISDNHGYIVIRFRYVECVEGSVRLLEESNTEIK